MEQLKRAQHLLQLGRQDEAEKELKKGLSEDPNNPFAMSMLASILIHSDRKQEGLELAKQAVGIAPDIGYCLYNLAVAEWYNNNVEKAKSALHEAMQLDPTDAHLHYLHAQIAFKNNEYATALGACEEGLELDPESVELINLRAQCLVRLNRKAEAAATLDYALHNAPDNSDSHANKGWVHIESGDFDAAEAAFKEALRLSPSNEYARSGLLETIKGRNPIYRVIQKYFLWMQKLGEKYQWGVVIGAYLIYRFVLRLYESNPALAPLLLPILIFYVTFAFSSWIARAISNLALRMHPMAKHVLDDDEIEESTYAGVLLLAVAIGLGVYFGLNEEYGFRLAIVSGLLMIPLGGAFTFPKAHHQHKKLLYFLIGMAIVGGAWIVMPELTFLAGIFFLAIFFYSFVFNSIVKRESKRFM